MWMEKNVADYKKCCKLWLFKISLNQINIKYVLYLTLWLHCMFCNYYVINNFAESVINKLIFKIPPEAEKDCGSKPIKLYLELGQEVEGPQEDRPLKLDNYWEAVCCLSSSTPFDPMLKRNSALERRSTLKSDQVAPTVFNKYLLQQEYFYLWPKIMFLGIVASSGHKALPIAIPEGKKWTLQNEIGIGKTMIKSKHSMNILEYSLTAN